MTMFGSFWFANTGADAYSVDNSAMFDFASAEHLTRTPTTAGNRRTWTWSGWVKRAGLGNPGGPNSSHDLFGVGSGSRLRFTSGDALRLESPSGNHTFITTQLFRDTHAWYHIVLAFDSTQATDTNRRKLYVNGSQVTDFSSTTFTELGQNAEWNINSTSEHQIAKSNLADYFGGYLAEVVLVDGSALGPTSFGETDDNGVWRPISIEDAGLTFGTNGFYLPFTTSAGLGQDYSGSSSETKVQENTYNAGSEVNNGDMSGSAAGIAYTAIATAKLATVKINSSSRGFTNVTVQVQTDNGSNAPDGTTLTNGQVTGITGSGSGLKTVDFPNGGPELTAGTKYWIVIPSTDLGSGFEWGIQHDVSGSGGALGIIDATGYQAGRGFGHEVFQLGNIWTPVNSPTQTSDSPTNNHCVWSEVFPKRSGNWTLSEGNRKASYSSATDCGCPGSIGVSGAGTWYFEITASSSYTLAGIVSAKAVSSGDLASSTPGNGFSDLGGVAYGYYANNGYKLGGPSNVHASYGATFANTDVIGVAFDAANGTLTFYKNGSTQGQAFTGISTSETWFPFVHTWTNEPGVLLNNGQTAFAHTPPTGYVGINTTNLLSASTPTIEDGSAYFQTTLYTGNGASSHEINQSGENSTFAPDFLWTKGRTTTEHRITDILRGATKVFFTDSSLGNSASTTETTSVLSLDSDGFTVGSGGGTNSSGDAKLGWQWKAGDSNTAVSASGSGDGYINACTHRANQTAGFSLVKYTGANSQISNGQDTKVTHGLGAKPELALIKSIDSTLDWIVLSTSTTGFAADSQTGDDAHLKLNSNAIINGSLYTGHFESGSDSTHFEVGNDNGVNKNGDEFMAFLFRSIPGYCKVTSYEGNGNSDGIFLELGFKASWIMFKRYTGSTASWVIYDKARDPFNAAENMMIVESTAGDNVGNKMDILSNGVKIRGTSGAYNGSGNEYLVLAFAEHPFVGTTPATAR